MSYSSEFISGMEKMWIASKGDQLQLFINEDAKLSIAQDTNECFNLYVSPATGGYDVYYESSTSDHTPTASDVRKVAALNGEETLQMSGGNYDSLPVIIGEDDIRYGTPVSPDTVKFNLLEIEVVICVKYALYNWGTGNTADYRNTASIKITKPSPSTESDCAYLPKQSFCYCNNC
ncbi:MAG: hypothetical protein U0V74_01800 [Chitinophagales bacterium]